MRHLLTTAVLGLGLLSAGGRTTAASANPYAHAELGQSEKATALVVPVHYDDYGVFKSPLSEFREAVLRRGLTDAVRFVERGDVVQLPSSRTGS